MNENRTSDDTRARRRQWGADRRSDPIPWGPPPNTDRRVTAGRIAVMSTVVAWAAYFATWLNGEFITGGANTNRTRVEAFVYLIIVTFLTASALAYLVSRLGFLYRTRDHRPVPRVALDEFFGQAMPTLTTIVPSYREDERVIRNTLLSAALQEYPYMRVVLLIDDPPVPRTKDQRRLLVAARELPGKIEALLDGPAQDFAAALSAFEHGPEEVSSADASAAADVYERAVGYLQAIAADLEVVDHTDQFFVDHVVLALAADFATVASALRAAVESGIVPPHRRLHQLYRRLAWTFKANVTSFERKRYTSLSSEANKAMNLNSYIGLMGGSYLDVPTVSGRVLVPCSLGHGDLYVPDPDYVLTLDADSILLPEYCLRLVHLMEQTQFCDVAVAQCPYTAFPGASSRLERIAGATTDIQHIVHQGMTHYDATFWVGANAILRKRALDDICEKSYVGDFEIRRYVQDRTVIEDTESTVDLARRGWTLYNYPARLAYSATPPDFGSLCIQRRRWANGGLLILGKYWRTVRERKRLGEQVRFGERFLRANYMASIFWSSVSLLLLLAYPFHNDLVSPLLGLIALPYFVAMASDLKLNGYKRADVLRIYGFNLILVAVNLAGVGASLVQLITGDKSAFGRTPKVRNRTVPNLLFVGAPYLVLGLAAYTLVADLQAHRYVNLVYAALNLVLVAYAIVAFIGVRHSLVDMFVQARARLYKPVHTPTPTPVRPAAVLAGRGTADWSTVLQLGHVALPTRSARPPRPLTNPTLTSGASLGSGARPAGSTRRDAMSPPGGPRGPEGTGERLRHAPASGRSHGRPTEPRHAPVPRARTSSVDDRPFEPDVAFRPVFQPIFDLRSNQVVGFEALTRFEDGLEPTHWLEIAAQHGAVVELEAALARAAVRAARHLPEDAWLAVNVSAAFAGDERRLSQLVSESSLPIVLELDALVSPREALPGLLAALPEGLRFSLSGMQPTYESLALIDELRPDMVKLNRQWVKGIAGDRAGAALARSVVDLADGMSGMVVAEGIETPEDLEAVADIGVHYGQGFLLGRPRDVTATWSQPMAAAPGDRP